MDKSCGGNRTDSGGLRSKQGQTISLYKVVPELHPHSPPYINCNLPSQFLQEETALKLCQGMFRLDIGNNFFMERVQLPRAVVEFPFLEGFKSHTEIAEFTNLHSQLP